MGGRESRAVGSASGACPFFFPAGRAGCLLLHGFTATPQEMRFLGERLHAAGHSVSGIQVAGHGASIAEFEQRTWREWYASASDGLSALRRHASRVVAVGQSMGALLALQLAAQHPAEVDGVALLSPALVLSRRWLGWVAQALRPLEPVLPQRYRCFSKSESDIADAGARAERVDYRQVPVRALLQLLALQKQVRRTLPQIRQPALVIHSRQDHTCPVDNVAMLERSLGGAVRSVLLENSFHVISVDVDKELVAAEVAAFVARITGAGGEESRTG